jgi:hypothetical protein
MRKTLTYTVADEGRDKSKVFLITEMSAAEAEDWALQAFFAIMNAGIEIPDSIAEMGFAGIAAIGLKALGKVPFYMADPLLKKPSVVRALIDSDIEEAATRLKLKKAVFDLHTSFLKLAAP